MNTPAVTRFTSVKEAYRLWAPLYDTTPNPLLSLEQRSLSRMLPSAMGCDIVDLGCGTGRWLRQLANLGPRSLVGVDFSEEMLAQASMKQASGVRLVQGDCLATPLPDASSDLILASFLLSYTDDLRRFAHEAARIARAGAVLLISDVHPDTRGYGWKRTFRSADQVIEIQSHAYQITDLQREMNNAGFDPLFLREFPFGDEEKSIYFDAGRADLFFSVQDLPVLFIAGYRKSLG
jgi:ubiquinone/menaquinone biosynthesis C-methylase UbiE